MTTTPPTGLPTARAPLPSGYATPPNSQGYTQHFPPQLPQQVTPQYPQQYQQPYPPIASSTMGTPTNLSPASPTIPSDFPNLPLANRQLRPPKSPMYIPAALRPTERQHHPSPLTPPRSVHGSTDSLDNTGSGRPTSRRSTADGKKNTSNQVAEDDLPPAAANDLPEITGLPTRTHWKPDANASICDAPVCQKRFNLWERRHHCRHCGNVFCAEHSGWQVPLDQNADFNPRGAQCRACGHCWAEYGRWMEERVSGPLSSDLATSSAPVKAAGRGAKSPEDKRSSIAQSLTRDWNWSTF